MKDTFSRRQWVEYTCGVAPVALAGAMDGHIRRCRECAAISRQLREIDCELAAAAAVLRASISGLESPAERAYDRWGQQRLPASGAGHLSRRIVRLQLFLAPICGFGTAQRAMFAAAGRSAAGSVDLLTEPEWPSFVKHLSSIVGALCGEPAGHLLWRIGQPSGVELS